MEYPGINFILISYNQSDYIEEAILAALNQDYPYLDIIISDDCSTDDTFLKAQSIVEQYKGPHNVVLRKTTKNLGIGGHINDVMSIAQHELIVIAAGDDISLENRCKEMATAFINNGKRFLSIHTDAIGINTEGLTIKQISSNYTSDLEHNVKHKINVLGACQAWTKDLFTYFGPLNNNVVYEDLTIPFRASLVGKVIKLDNPLVKYRLSASAWKSTGNKDKRAMIRHKNGVLTITAYRQMKKDLNLVDDISADRKKLLNKLIDHKIKESEMFIYLLDRHYYKAMGHILKKGISSAELRAIKRLIRI